MADNPERDVDNLEEQPQTSPRSDEEFGVMPASVGQDETGQNQQNLQSVTVEPPKSEQDGDGYLGPRRRRITGLCLLLLWLCVFVFPRWFDYNKVKSSGQKWVDAYKLHAAGAVIIFVGVILIQFAVLMENRINCCQNRVWKFIVMAILLLGGFLYWVGGIQLAKSINDLGSNFDKTHRYHYSGWAGSVFIEATFVALISIALGLDYIANVLKNDRVRTYLVLNTVLGFTALVAFFSYAAWRAYGVSDLSMSRTACVSAGWFFVLVACIYLYVVGFSEICCKFSATAQREIREKPGKIKTGAIVVLLFGGFIVMVGMWSIATLSDKYWNCYYAGYGFFVFFFCLLLALDVHLGEVIQRRFQR